MLYLPRAAAASTLTLTSQTDWDAGTKTSVETESRLGDLKLEASGTWNVKAWKTPNLTISAGATMVSDGTDIYVVRGLGDTDFWKYSPTSDKWTSLADLPRGAYYGSDMTVLSGYIYYIAGGYQRYFARYSISANTWEALTDVPDLVYSGGSIGTDGTDIFVLKGNASQDFYKYTLSSTEWSNLASTPATIGAGADLVYDEGYFYTLRGGNSTAFYRWSAAGGWENLAAVLPAAINGESESTTDGTYIYTARMTNLTTFYRYTIGGSWETITAAPQLSQYAGVVYHSADGYVYFFRGNGTFDFWKYDNGAAAYVGPADAPATLTTGSDLVYYDGYLYAPRGGAVTMYRYSLSGNSWETLTDATASLTDDTKGIAAGSYLYFYRGGNTATFYRYTPGGGWDTMTNTLSNVRYGGTLAYPGSGDFIYGTRGADTLTFWRYSIEGNSWSDVAVADLPTGATASYGARLISDGTDIYYIAGLGISRFFHYSVLNNTWTEKTSPPFAPYYGTDLAYRSGRIVALAGYYKTDLWEYIIADNAWRRLPDIAGYRTTSTGANIGPYNGASIEYDGSSTFYLSRGTARAEILSFTPTANDYPVSGTWISASQDLTYVSSWTSLAAGTTTPDDSSITFYTRSSADNSTWDDWTVVTGETIGSTARRYLQVKAELAASTDRGDTPTLSSVTVTYATDSNAPTNPTSFTGSSQQSGGTALTSGTTYRHVHPYFSWDGAADAETSVTGYYVYFGTTSDADPAVSGIYQTGRNYLVSETLATGTYYLRLKTKDAAGNTSAAVAGFTYVYSGVSPASTLLVDETTEFTGDASNTAVSSDEIKLSGKAGFWVEDLLSNAPGGMQYGAQNEAYVSSTGKLYYFQGNNGTAFYEYDLANDAWTTKAVAPANVRLGGGVVEGPSGYLYGWSGNGATSFWRYTIASDSWSDAEAADISGTTYYGTSAVYDGSQYIYLMRGYNTDDFYRYDTGGDSWSTMASTDFGATTYAVNNNVYVGGDLAFDGSDTIYATQGSLRDGFASYSISGNTWATLPDVPQLPYNGSALEYDATRNCVYYLPGYSTPQLYKYDISSQEWTKLTDAPAPFDYGANMRLVGNYIYALRGAGSTTFYKYDIVNNRWIYPTRGLFGSVVEGTRLTTDTDAYYGADIVKGDGNYFYLTRGYYDNDFVRYDSSSGTVTRMSDLPTGVYNGSSMVYDSTDNKIYLTAGTYVQKFFVYDIATDAWSEVTTDPPLAMPGYGTSMVYDGSRYIYMNRGSDSTTFYRYDTDGNAGARWEARTAASGTLGYGAELAKAGDYLYTLRGSNTANNPFYRYDIGDNSWSDPAVADLTIDVYDDGWLTNGGDGYLYAARGDNDNDFYRYSVSGNSWETLTNVPDNIDEGGSGESNELNKIFVLPGSGTNSIADGLYTYVMQTNSSSFEASGTYTSPVHDLTSIYQFANLSVTYTSAANATLAVTSRTSADNVTWSDWTAVANEKISGTTYTYTIESTAARYLQLKFSFTSADSILSGVVADYTVNWYQDTDAAANPTSISGYSDATKTTSITSGWNGHAAPHFDWPEAEATGGATDTATGSGVAGYYVYYGTTADADPAALGSYQTTTDYTASSMSSGSTYYLRIKTKDTAGNIAATAWDAFNYSYDATNPTNPQTVTADPSGYTATNSFTFAWSGATDTGTGISEYCYKTGASGAEDTCISDTTVSGITAYVTGVNTFYVRSKDGAGNMPTEYSTASYYYNATAPSPPQDVIITPSTNTVNEFAFEWDPPATYQGAQSALRYYYSINEEPSATNVNTVGLSNEYLPEGAYATQQGENTFYVVAKDEAGNIDYALYYKDPTTNRAPVFTIETDAPGEPANMEIADVSVKATNSWRIALSWDVPTDVGAGIDNYKIWRSDTTSANCDTDISDFTALSTSSTNSYVNVGLTQKTWYYCVQSCDSVDNCSSYSDTVYKYPDGRWLAAPDLTSGPTVTVKTKSAIVIWTTSRTANSFVKYGTSAGSYGSEVGSSTQVTSHEVSIPELSPGTTYYYKVLYTDEDGNQGSSTEKSFTTNAAPRALDVSATDVGINQAYVTFTVENCSSATLQYGKTVAYGQSSSLTTSTSKTTYTVKLENLAEGTNYHFTITTKDAEGNSYAGDDYTFETLPTPKITQAAAQQIRGMATATIRVLWLTNTPVNSVITYYPKGNTEAALDGVLVELTTGHEMIIDELADDTEYVFELKGRDIAGNDVETYLLNIKTALDMRPAQIKNLQVESSIRGVGQEAWAQVTISYDTDEPTTSQVEYGEGTSGTFSAKTQEDTKMVMTHFITIPNLQPSKVYHLQVVSKDKANNVSRSSDTVVITPKATSAAVDLVVKNLSGTFGFVSKFLK